MSAETWPDGTAKSTHTAFTWRKEETAPKKRRSRANTLTTKQMKEVQKQALTRVNMTASLGTHGKKMITKASI